MVNNIIQLDFSEIDDKWWLRCSLWLECFIPDSLSRPTEDAALLSIQRQVRLLDRVGRDPQLSPLHKLALRYEYQCKVLRPYDLTPEIYVAERLHLGEKMTLALLQEASVILLAREMLGLVTVVDWRAEPKAGKRKRAA